MTLIPDVATLTCEPQHRAYREIGVAAVAAALAEFMGEAAPDAPHGAGEMARAAA